VEIACRVYRPRDPRKTPLYGLLDSLYVRVKGAWEERFERSYGFWRGLVDEAVASYLACGLWQGGFARVRCRRCPEEFLVACTIDFETMMWHHAACARSILFDSRRKTGRPSRLGFVRATVARTTRVAQG